jgi:hypothetical protein
MPRCHISPDFRPSAAMNRPRLDCPRLHAGAEPDQGAFLMERKGIHVGRSSLPAAVLGISLATGLALAGWQVADAVIYLRAAQRVVTVKGLAVREAAADLAIWPVVYSVSADSLAEVQESSARSAAIIREFLRQRGFQDTEMFASIPRVTDFQTQMPGISRPPEDRYMAQSSVTLRTRDVSRLKAAMQDSGELVARGVTLVRSYESEPLFLFTSLEELKPQMIAAATRDARRAAQQFAEDSGSRVGAIRRARQGYFSITDRDSFSPEQKNIRVVTTVEYFLVD